MIFKNFVVVNYHRTNMKSDSQITDMMNRINIISWKKQKHKYLTRLRRVYNSTTIGVRPKWVGMVLSRIVDSCGGDTAVTYPHPIIISLFRTSWTLSRWGIFVNYFWGQIEQPSSFFKKDRVNFVFRISISRFHWYTQQIASEMIGEYLLRQFLDRERKRRVRGTDRVTKKR